PPPPRSTLFPYATLFRSVERQIARAIRATVKSNGGICPATRDIFIDRLANARFQLSEVARQIDHDIALLSVHRVQLHAKFSSGMDHLGAAVPCHASHSSMQKVIAEKRSTFNVQRWLKGNEHSNVERQPGIRYAGV